MVTEIRVLEESERWTGSVGDVHWVQRVAGCGWFEVGV